ncbi:MAG: hypothetical protein ACKOWJ_01055 [Micrococcales bacterium]
MAPTNDELDDFAEDEAEQLWGGGPVSLSRVHGDHIPFYKFALYMDRLDLRRVGYELEKFEGLFDLLDEARMSQAKAVNRLLHLPTGTAMVRGGNQIWKPRRARELEFRVLEVLHQFGLAVVPATLRRILGQAFNHLEMNAIDVDLIDVFYWAALAKVARDYSWRDERLEEWCDYLEYPVRRAFGATYAYAS